MPYFSKISEQRKSTCHPDLQCILDEVINYLDFSIYCGERDKNAQNAAYRDGLSKKKYPESRHNTHPSMAVDIAPYPINETNKSRFAYFIGFIEGVAEMFYLTGKITHKIRWGGDWDMDLNVKDKKLDWDLYHIELIV